MSVVPPTDAAAELYDLIPAVYRIRDVERGQVLRQLLEVLAGQVEVLREDLAQLYDDQFIETCQRWVAPYIGDLIGYRLLHGVLPAVASPRAEVANTIRYRRRKGTASMLEQLARDVTGWPARAVEFFERLVTTQYMNHPRLHSAATPDLRATESLAWVTTHNGAFDDLAHTVNVRRIATGAGRHNIPNVGIFLWRTEAAPLTRSPLTPHSGDDRRFRFDPLGMDAPLFGRPRTEDEISHIAEPFDVPLPLSRRWLADHLDAYYGPGLSLLIETESGSPPVFTARPIGEVRVCDLSDDPGGSGAWVHEPPPGTAAIDPVLGRVYFGTALPAGTAAFATYHQGVAVPVGAGGFARPEAETPAPVFTTAGGGDLQPNLTLAAQGGTVRIVDCARYEGTPTVAAAAPGSEVAVQAADHARPIVDLGGPLQLSMAPGTTVVLDGLLITGGAIVLPAAAAGDVEPRSLVLRQCTLVPGVTRKSDGAPGSPQAASLVVRNPFAGVRLERCIVGPIMAIEGAEVTARDSIIDASARDGVAFAAPGTGEEVTDGTVVGGDLDLRQCTVIGGVSANQLDCSNSVLIAALAPADPRATPVRSRRRQVGCVRFSALPAEARTGRQYRCVTDAAPHYTSLRFGHPAYGQLAASTPDVIRRGADDESEMGVSHLLYTPQREANLLLRLDEYLRFGLEAGFFYAT